MIKRIFDICASLIGLILMSPFLVIACIAVWLQDFKSPLYIADRVGKNETLFKMIKIRSMVVNADKSGVDSTSASDMRITTIGKIIRKLKLDEFSQLFNVLKGDMSLVGPRPNVIRDTRLYTDIEKKLLSVRPGITDFSSIVFADEGNILEGHEDPDLSYNQLIRPYKSRLGLLYIDKSNLILDIRLILLTILLALSRSRALNIVANIVKELGAEQSLIDVCKREKPLKPAPPPGASKIVDTREVAA